MRVREHSTRCMYVCMCKRSTWVYVRVFAVVSARFCAGAHVRESTCIDVFARVSVNAYARGSIACVILSHS